MAFKDEALKDECLYRLLYYVCVRTCECKQSAPTMCRVFLKPFVSDKASKFRDVISWHSKPKSLQNMACVQQPVLIVVNGSLTTEALTYKF